MSVYAEQVRDVLLSADFFSQIEELESRADEEGER